MKKLLIVLVAVTGFGFCANAQSADVNKVTPYSDGRESGYKVEVAVKITDNDCKGVNSRKVQVSITPTGIDNLQSKATQYDTDLVSCGGYSAKYKIFTFKFPCKDGSTGREQCSLYNFNVNAKFTD